MKGVDAVTCDIDAIAANGYDVDICRRRTGWDAIVLLDGGFVVHSGVKPSLLEAVQTVVRALGMVPSGGSAT